MNEWKLNRYGKYLRFVEETGRWIEGQPEPKDIVYLSTDLHYDYPDLSPGTIKVEVPSDCDWDIEKFMKYQREMGIVPIINETGLRDQIRVGNIVTYRPMESVSQLTEALENSDMHDTMVNTDTLIDTSDSYTWQLQREQILENYQSASIHNVANPTTFDNATSLVAQTDTVIVDDNGEEQTLQAGNSLFFGNNSRGIVTVVRGQVIVYRNETIRTDSEGTIHFGIDTADSNSPVTAVETEANPSLVERMRPLVNSYNEAWYQAELAYQAALNNNNEE